MSNVNNKKYLENLFFIFGISISLILIWNLLYYLLNTNVWRHDEFFRLDFNTIYYAYLPAEGRWLTFLPYMIIKLIPPHLCILISLFCFFYFSYTVSRQFLDKKWALFSASIFLQVPSIYFFSGWPQTLLINYILIAIAATCYNKIKPIIFFIIFGILFNGAQISFYDILPLLFISDLRKGKINFYFLIFIWIFGFIVGHILTQLIVYIISEHFIRPDPWRNPNYINSLSNFFTNINTFINNILSNLNILKYNRHYNYLILLLTITIIIYSFIKSKSKKNILITYFLILFISLSIYAQLFPIGVGIPPRAALPLYLCLLFIPLFVYKNTLFYSIAAIIFALFMFTVNYNTVKTNYIITNTFLSEFKNLKLNPDLHDIYFLSDSDQVYFVENNIRKTNSLEGRDENFAETLKWKSVAYSAGFRNVHTDQAARDKFAECKIDKFIDLGLYSYARNGYNIFIKFSSDYLYN